MQPTKIRIVYIYFEIGHKGLILLELNKSIFKEIIRVGEGPNEIRSTQNILFRKHSMFWGNSYSKRLMETTFTGEYLSERFALHPNQISQ